MMTSQEIDPANIKTITKWVEQLSDGFFTSEATVTLSGVPGVRIFRKDGKPLATKEGEPVNGTFSQVVLPYLTALDRRYTLFMGEVARAVEFAENALDAPEIIKKKLASSRDTWKIANRVKD